MLRLFQSFLLIIICICLQAQPSSFHSAAADPPQAGAMFIFPERIPLEDSGFLHAERGMLFVPLNRSDPDTDVISVEVYRFKRNASADSSTPPIFYLHGGPSFGGLERSLKEPGTFESRWEQFTEISDLVIISQRGIGPSKPTTTIETTIPNQRLDQPHSAEAATEAFQAMLDAERQAWEDLGLDLQGFTVLEAATDIEDVRRALGYDKITLWGGSFGSHWGMAYMREYGQHVARAVMRGMEGPDHTYDHPGHLWNVYKRVAADAESSEVFAGKIPPGGLLRALESMVRQTEEKPFILEVDNHEVLFDGQSMRRLTRGYSAGLRGWPANVITMHAGNFEPAAKRMVERNTDDERSFRTASYWMLDCGSGITPERSAEYDADPSLGMLWGWNWWYKTGCQMWDSDLGDDFRKNFYTDIPTVIVHGTWDTATPFENAEELVPYFRNSKFIPVLRGPHSAIRAAFRQSPEFKKALFHFAATGDMSRLPEQVELPEPEWIVPE